MNFSCEKNELLAAISIATRAAAPKSPIAALEGILVEAGTKSVRFTGYDLKRGIYTDAEAEVRETGSIVLGAKIFESIVRSLPDGEVTVRTEDATNALITCGRSEFSILGSDFVDYPELPSVDSQAGVSLPQNILSTMIRQTVFAVADTEARPVLTGELFEISGDSLTIVAVDGYRIALRRERLASEQGEYSFIVPGRTLSDLEKLCGDTDEPVRITLGEKHISFTIGKTVIISRRLEGEFLDYRKVVPAEFTVKVIADRPQLQRAVERMSLIIEERNTKVKSPVRCTFGEDNIKLVCATAVGKAEDICPVEGDGGGLLVGFGNRFLLDALKAAPSDELKLCLNSSTAPCLIYPADESDDSFMYLILPRRIQPA